MRFQVKASWVAAGLALATVLTPTAGSAQLARPSTPPPADAPEWTAAGGAQWAAQGAAQWSVSAPGARGASGAQSAPSEIPLAAANKIQMLQTMAGPAIEAPQYAECDANEIVIGPEGGAVVAGDINIINKNGAGKCPPLGKTFTPPPGLTPGRNGL